jgi:hypothetical protein
MYVPFSRTQETQLQVRGEGGGGGGLRGLRRQCGQSTPFRGLVDAVCQAWIVDPRSSFRDVWNYMGRQGGWTLRGDHSSEMILFRHSAFIRSDTKVTCRPSFLRNASRRGRRGQRLG